MSLLIPSSFQTSLRQASAPRREHPCARRASPTLVTALRRHPPAGKWAGAAGNARRSARERAESWSLSTPACASTCCKAAGGAPRALVVAGPSGVGKGTLIGMLMKRHPGRFGFSVSHTTRQPREGELDGVHYHFTTVEGFEDEIDAGKFLEHARVHGKVKRTST